MFHSPYPVPDPLCGVCKEPVSYRSRRKCGGCRTWCHGACVGLKNSCLCSIPSAAEIRRIVAEARLGDLSGEVVVAMLYLGPDEAKIAAYMGADPEAVAIMGKRLRNNGVWKDGKVHLEFLDKPDEIVIELALFACIAEGWVESRPA